MDIWLSRLKLLNEHKYAARVPPNSLPEKRVRSKVPEKRKSRTKAAFRNEHTACYARKRLRANPKSAIPGKNIAAVNGSGTT